MSSTFYQILNFSYYGQPRELKNAFINCLEVRKFDFNPKSEKDRSWLFRILVAYKTLSNFKNRVRYNKEIKHRDVLKNALKKDVNLIDNFNLESNFSEDYTIDEYKLFIEKLKYYRKTYMCEGKYANLFYSAFTNIISLQEIFLNGGRLNISNDFIEIKKKRNL